jgi:hypothetical protein
MTVPKVTISLFHILNLNKILLKLKGVLLFELIVLMNNKSELTVLISYTQWPIGSGLQTLLSTYGNP